MAPGLTPFIDWFASEKSESFELCPRSSAFMLLYEPPVRLAEGRAIILGVRQRHINSIHSLMLSLFAAL